MVVGLIGGYVDDMPSKILTRDKTENLNEIKCSKKRKAKKKCDVNARCHRNWYVW